MLDNDIGLSLGLLAGTTFGSGVGFLFSWQSYQLVGSVALFGVLGAVAGLWYARKSRRARQSP